MASALSFAVVLLFLSAPLAAAVDVLVFGDSQGDTGPTYKVVQDQLSLHNVSDARVVNAAIGGTLSCGWAKDPDAVAKAGRDAFGAAGPDVVWLTVGGNDMAGDAKYHSCLDKAEAEADAKACTKAATDRLMPCTVSLLKGLWSAFPNARVGMYNYEVGCISGECVSAAEEFLGGSYCARSADPVACIITQIAYWQTIYVDELQRRYARPKFTGMNVLGAAQQASGVAGASVGHPMTTAGSRCDWFVACVHPKYGTPTATAIGKAMWDLWLSNVTASE
eukprot:g5577.t1